MHDSDDVVSGVSRTDALIDRTARELTAGEPSPRLRHAVRQRLAQRATRWAVPMWVSALAAAAALVIVAAGVMTSGRLVIPASPVAPQVAKAPLALPQPNARTERPERGTERPERPARAERSERRVPIEIAPLVIEPLVTQRLAAETSSGVMPIEIDDLRIEPLRIE